MTTQAGSHVVIHKFLRGIHLSHIAVAGDALHIGVEMSRVIEPDEGVWLKSVHTLPRDFNALAA